MAVLLTETCSCSRLYGIPTAYTNPNIKFATSIDLQSVGVAFIFVMKSYFGVIMVKKHKKYKLHKGVVKRYLILSATDVEQILLLELEREGKVIASSNEHKCDVRSLNGTDGLKISETFSKTHQLVKKAIRGDVIKVMKTITKSPINSPANIPKVQKSKKKLDVSGPIPTLTEFKLKIAVLPDSAIKINQKHIGGVLTHSLPPYIKSLMDQIKVAVQEAVLETKEYAKVHGAHTREVSSVPFYGFCEGPTMIADMEETCLSHFNSLVSSKVCLMATKFKADLRFSRKIVSDFIRTKEFQQGKMLLHKEFKNDSVKNDKLCVIS